MTCWSAGCTGSRSAVCSPGNRCSTIELGRDASKVALVTLVELLRASGPEGGRLLDVQWQTDHLASLGGVIEVTRADYLDLLEEALTVPPPCWDLPGRG